MQGSALEAMFSGRQKLIYLAHGAIFVDRDADVFSMVVSYLRNGCKYPVINDSVLHERFDAELEFWGLQQ